MITMNCIDRVEQYDIDLKSYIKDNELQGWKWIETTSEFNSLLLDKMDSYPIEYLKWVVNYLKTASIETEGIVEDAEFGYFVENDDAITDLLDFYLDEWVKDGYQSSLKHLFMDSQMLSMLTLELKSLAYATEKEFPTYLSQKINAIIASIVDYQDKGNPYQASKLMKL